MTTRTRITLIFVLQYPGLTNQQVFEKVVGGYRMEQPQGCPDVIYRMMWNCWRLTKRPTFGDMEKVKELISMYTNCGQHGCLAGFDGSWAPY
jgi:hypothetical protein